VLDFGLAKVDGEGTAADLTHSPTVTVGGTREGVILGTAAYMSPEQARGKPLDKRTDIWSFGCVLYDMLAGRQAFGGETVSDSIAAILGREPDWTALDQKTPATVRRLLQRCLEKDPKQRLRDIGDVRHELDHVLADLRSPGGPSERVVAKASARSIRGPMAAAAAMLLILLGAVGAYVLRQTTPTARAYRSGVPFDTLWPKGLKPEKDVAANPGAKVINEGSAFPASGSAHLFWRQTTQSNLYRVPLPN
jgi:eukaryotic-like serine/threonine-protein kinase